MRKKEKLIHQLFIGKVSSIIGNKKVIELLREAQEAFEGCEGDKLDCYKCNSKDLKPTEYKCNDCGHNGYYD